MEQGRGDQTKEVERGFIVIRVINKALIEVYRTLFLVGLFSLRSTRGFLSAIIYSFVTKRENIKELKG